MGLALMGKKFLERVFNIGIAEQNIILVAAGLAATGMKVFAASYVPFLSMRACEQIRTFIAYTNLNVKIIAGMGGLFGGMDGKYY
jgi:transketolase